MSTDQSSPLRPLVTGVTVVVVLTLAVALYCGMYTQRFVPFRGIDESRALLKELPLTIEDWVAEKEGTLDSTSIHMLEIENGYVTRRYKNTKTQSEVNFVLMLGPTGRVVVHTPETCFGGRNYEKENAKTSISLPGKALSDEEPGEENFWKISFINRSFQGEKISFYYAVSSGGNWTAARNPRYDFSGFLFVYRIQVEAIIDRDGADPAYAFLTDALPTIRQHMKPCR